MQAGTILIDADDTLWLDHVYFKKLRKVILNLAKESSGSRERIDIILNGSSAGEAGFREAALSMGRILQMKGSALVELELAVAEFSSHPIELLPYAKEFLEKTRLHKILYTKGITSEQQLKLERSGLASLFSSIHVAEEKTASVLDDFLKKNALRASECFYIGNSIKHDIIPALEVGCRAIWLNHEDNYFDRTATIPEGIHVAHSWSEVENIVHCLSPQNAFSAAPL
jgi:putative hydrolase of the HAD superfamily